MLRHYLQQSVEDLQNLIQITKDDIEDIKQAKHDSLFGRNRTKEDLLASFGNKKAIIDNEIVKIANNNPGKQLDDLLDEETSQMLGKMRESLQELKSVNKHYARMVLAVYEFYNTLLEKLLPPEQNGYHGKQQRAATFLKVEA